MDNRKRKIAERGGMDCQQSRERTLKGVAEVDEELIETFLLSSIQV